MNTLHIYQTTLKIPLAQEFDKGCEGAGPHRQHLLSKVDKAISKKKMKRLALLRKVATGVLITVIGGIILFFLKQSYQTETDATSKTIKSQPSSPQEAKIPQLSVPANYSELRRSPPEKKLK